MESGAGARTASARPSRRATGASASSVPALGDLAALRHLDVGDNEIEAFEGGDHASMETLAIYSNRLASLESLPRFENLRFLGVGYNSIEALPRAL